MKTAFLTPPGHQIARLPDCASYRRHVKLENMGKIANPAIGSIDSIDPKHGVVQNQDRRIEPKIRADTRRWNITLLAQMS